MWSIGDDAEDQPGVQRARQIGRAGTWDDLPELEELLYASGWVVHAEAAEAMGRLAVRTGNGDDLRVLGLLKQVASGGTSDRLRRDHTPESYRKLCAGGARGLGILGTALARAYLRRAIRHPEVEVRAAMCAGFGALQDTEGEAMLYRLADDDPHPYVRRCAAEALKEYPPPVPI